VIDWELSTLGDPLCDLADNCRAYYLPNNIPLFPCMLLSHGILAVLFASVANFIVK